jgi:hypothetical protein
VPRPINVDMFGLRFTIDRAPRTKSGQPAHRTIGSVSTSSIQLCTVMSNQPSRRPNIASTVTTTVNGSVPQKRGCKSTSSGFPASSSSGSTGSNVMPHFGQLPRWP